MTFQATITLIPQANQIVVSCAEGVLTIMIACIAMPKEAQVALSAKEFLRSRIVGRTCSVTPFKRLDDTRMIARVTIAGKSLADQLAKNGFCQAFGDSEEAQSIAKLAQNAEAPKLLKLIDFTQRSSELTTFV